MLVISVSDTLVDWFSFSMLMSTKLEEWQQNGKLLHQETSSEEKSKRITELNATLLEISHSTNIRTRRSREDIAKQKRMGPVKSASFTRTGSIFLRGFKTTRIFFRMWLKSIPSSTMNLIREGNTFQERRFVAVVFLVHRLHVSKVKVVILVVMRLHLSLVGLTRTRRWSCRINPLLVHTHKIILRVLIETILQHESTNEALYHLLKWIMSNYSPWLGYKTNKQWYTEPIIREDSRRWRSMRSITYGRTWHEKNGLVL